MPAGSGRATFARGLALHLTNPKPILFFGSLYSLGVSPDTSAMGLATVIVAVGVQALVIFHGYALLFSHPGIARGYRKLRRALEAAFALAFGMAGLKVLTARLT
jgi:threonine/homoserine/homoserine lactone efflux protein